MKLNIFPVSLPDLWEFFFISHSFPKVKSEKQNEKKLYFSTYLATNERINLFQLSFIFTFHLKLTGKWHIFFSFHFPNNGIFIFFLFSLPKKWEKYLFSPFTSQTMGTFFFFSFFFPPNGIFFLPFLFPK